MSTADEALKIVDTQQLRLSRSMTDSKMDETPSFEQAAFALIKAMSPSKQVPIEDIPVNSLKHLIADFFAQRRSGSAAGKAEGPLSPKSIQKPTDVPQCTPGKPSFSIEDEDSRMSCPDSEDSTVSTNDGESRSSAVGLSRRRNSLKANGSYASLASNGSSARAQYSLSGISLRQVKKAKKIQEMREARRKEAAHSEADEIECSESYLRDGLFSKWLSEGIAQDPFCPLHSYHRTINTLRNFYSRETWSTSVEKKVCEFLRGQVPRLRACSTSTETESENDDNRRIREVQVLILLELHVLANRLGGPENELEERKGILDPDDPERIDPVQFLSWLLSDLRYLYTATDSLTMKLFMERTIADTFAHLIPRTVAELFDSLCVNIPLDLEEYAPVHSSNSNSSTPQATPIKGAFFRCESFGSELTGATGATENDAPKRKRGGAGLDTLLSELSQSFGEVDDVKEEFHSSNVERKSPEKPTRNKPGKRKADSTLEAPKHSKGKVVPETPEEKLRRNRDVSDTEEIKATPMGKLRNTTRASVKATRLAELVRASEERGHRGSQVSDTVLEKSSRAMSQAASLSRVNPTSKSAFLALNTPSPRPQRAKSNLASKFAQLGAAQAPSSSGTPTSSRPPRRSCTLPKEPPASKEPKKKSEVEKKKKDTKENTKKAVKGKEVPSTSKARSASPEVVILKVIPASVAKRMKREPYVKPPVKTCVLRKSAFGLTQEVLDRFVQYRQTIKKVMAVHKKNKQSLPVPQLSAHQPLPEHLIPRTSKRQQKTQQTSRLGRAVAKHRDVYVSHILANTKNRKPLKPYIEVPNPNYIVFDKIEGENMRRRDYLRFERGAKNLAKRSAKKRRGLKRKASGSSGENSEENGRMNGIAEADVQNGVPAKLAHHPGLLETSGEDSWYGSDDSEEIEL